MISHFFKTKLILQNRILHFQSKSVFFLIQNLILYKTQIFLLVLKKHKNKFDHTQEAKLYQKSRMQRSRQQLKAAQKYNMKYVSIASSLIQAFSRSKIRLNKRDAVENIMMYCQFSSKRVNQFVRTLSRIIGRKQLNYKKQVIGVLIQNRISQILLKRQKINSLKLTARNNSLGLMSAIFLRNLKQKIRESFALIRFRGLEKLKRNTYKMAYLANGVKSIQRKLLMDGLKKIKLETLRRFTEYKQCFILQRLYLRKRINNIQDSFSSVYEFSFNNNNKPKYSNNQENLKPTEQVNINIVPQPQQQKEQIEKLQSQQKQLQQKTESLKLLTTKSLKQSSSQISSLEQQLQQLRFQYDLNIQSANELQQTLKQREFLSQSKNINALSSEKTQNFLKIQDHNIHINSHKQLSSQELWKSVFDNLLFYLVKCSKAQLKDNDSTQIKTQFNKQKLLQAITQPFVDVRLYPNTQELIQENAVLRQLLETYKQAFPQISLQNKDFSQTSNEILIKQKQYLIRSLECLAKWGFQSGDGLDEIKNALQRVKLNEIHQ